MRDGMLDYAGTTALTLRSAEIPGVVKLTIHTPTAAASALLDAYALSELQTIAQKALERTDDK